MSAEEVSRARAWLIATRPQTLPAGAAPVVVGTAIAVDDGLFAPGPAIAALVGALLIQIGTNLANDYYDAQRGVDTPDREGFTRVTHAGLIEAPTVKRAMALTFLSAIVLGGYLVFIGGIPIVIIGLVSVACGIAYAGGPFPFGSYGLGDLFVFVFFGLVATVGTYYVQATAVLADPLPLWVPPGTVSSMAMLAGVAMGALTTAILVVNNLRDIETDRNAGKRTLAVLIGPTLTKAEYVGMIAIALLIPVGMAIQTGRLVLAVPVLILPYALFLIRQVIAGRAGADLNRTLESTGKLLIGYALLFAVGVIAA